MPTVYRYSDTIADASTGRPVPNALIQLTDYPDGTAAPIYDANGTVLTAGSVRTGSNGQFTLYAEQGRYNLFVNGTVQQEDVAVGEYVGAVTGTITEIYSDATAGPQTVNLPSSGRAIIVKIDATTNAVTIVPASGKTVMYQPSIDLTVQGESVYLALNGNNWYRV